MHPKRVHGCAPGETQNLLHHWMVWQQQVLEFYPNAIYDAGVEVRIFSCILPPDTIKDSLNLYVITCSVKSSNFFSRFDLCLNLHSPEKSSSALLPS